MAAAEQVSVDGLPPDFAALAGEARRLEPRVVRVSTRTSGDYKTILVIDTAGLTGPQVEALSDALKVVRRRQDLVAEFVIVNSTGGEFGSRVPKGWPP